MFSLSTLIQYSSYVLGKSNKKKDRNIRDTNRKEVNLSLFIDDMTLYLKDPNDSSKATLRSDKHF
jgi:hypothetical protein